MKGQLKGDGEREKVKYFYVTYEPLDKKRKYGGDGVLSAPSRAEAVKKAKRAECLYDKPERGEFARFEEATEIKEVDFLVLESYTVNIDKHFMKDGVFRRNSSCFLTVVK